LLIRHIGAANYAASLFTICAAWATGRAIHVRREMDEALERTASLLAAERDDRARLAVAGERSRIARDLHAVVARSVAAMVVQAEAARGRLDGNPATADTALEAVEDVGRQALGEMRRILGVLRQRDHAGELLEPQPGVDQIYRLIERAREQGQQVELTIAGQPGTLSAGVDLGIYRILEEALASLRSHPATAMGIAMRFEEEDLELQLSTTYRGARDWPTDAMRQRVLFCGGELRSELHETDGARFDRASTSRTSGSPHVTIRVVIADDQQLIRAGFKMILSAEPDIEVVGEASTGSEAVDLTCELRPDVVLMDIRMPDVDGIEATRRILAQGHNPPPSVLILTTFDLDEYVYEALRAGASGFLLKDAPAPQLVAGIRTVGQGDALLAPSITRRLIAEFAATRNPLTAPASFSELTPRELEVFRLLATGMSNSEIAGELIVSETTIKTHVTRILLKLGVRDRVQAVVVAYETGLVSPRRQTGHEP
jgi:DNA-binding NarL/FixJ family response regulator